MRQEGRLLELDVGESADTIAKHLEEISKQMKRLLESRLTENAIIVLVRELLPRGSKISHQQIQEVFTAVKNLDRYVRKGTST
jgi:uncharacterized protein YneF (UPF0154 family)